MKYLISSLLCVGFGISEAAAQRAVLPLKQEFLDSTFTVLPSAVGARYRRETAYTDSVSGTVRAYYLSGKLQSTTFYDNLVDEIAHGPHETWYENGQLESHGESSHGAASGEWRSYYASGQPKSLAHYRAGKLIDSQCFSIEGQLQPCPFNKEVMPIYPEGAGDAQALVRAVNRNFIYPRSAVKAKVEGRVIVAFAVNARGEVVDVRIRQHLSPAIDAAAIEAVQKLKRFTPGTQNGKPVKVRYNVPLTLKVS
ncbi:MAG: TonB family protein [Cytophagaceae bacterium]|nr:MAG: TonB family protein [Cytophagaceae bacterium]